MSTARGSSVDFKISGIKITSHHVNIITTFWKFFLKRFTFFFANSWCRGKVEIDSRGTLCILFCTRLFFLAQPATGSTGNSADILPWPRHMKKTLYQNFPKHLDTRSTTARFLGFQKRFSKKLRAKRAPLRHPLGTLRHSATKKKRTLENFEKVGWKKSLNKKKSGKNLKLTKF